MLHGVFSVYDLKSEVFSNPFVVHNVAVATRMFGDQVNNPDTTLHAHPEDYQLFEFGTWDNESGKFKQHDVPKMITGAVPLLSSSAPSPKVSLAK